MSWKGTKKQLNKHFNSDNEHKKCFALLDIKERNECDHYTAYSTTSTYIGLLLNAKYIKRISLGYYKVIREIPLNLSLRGIKEFTRIVGESRKEQDILVDRYWKIEDLKNKMK